MSIDIVLDCNSVKIEPEGSYVVRATLEDVTASDLKDAVLEHKEVLDEVLQEADAEDIVENVDEGDLLEALGIDKCKEHFDLKEIE